MLSAVIFIGLIVLIIYAVRKANRGGEIEQEWDNRDNIREKEPGEWGELEIAELLKQCSLEGDKILSNLIVSNPQTGMTAQIDHIFLSVRGCFIIEVKDYSGTIYGKENEKEWRQVLGYRTMNVNTLYSPFLQNQTHIFVLKQLLHTKVYMENIVIFVQGNTENIDCKSVFSPKEFAAHLTKINTEQLSAQKRDELYDELLKLKECAVSKKEHIQNIQEQQWKIKNNICPRCGKSLVLRTGKYGQFYGCSGYPNCKFKKQIPKE